jgi:hypothetical protein
MATAVFLLCAALVFFASRVPPIRDRRTHGFRAEGITFVIAVLACCALGFLSTPRPSDQAAPDWGLQVLGLTLVVYVLAAVRGARRLPPWVADALIVASASAAVYAFGAPRIGASNFLLRLASSTPALARE